MFTSWLLNEFPRLIRHGWRLVQRDLVVWLALSGLFALVSVAGAGIRGSEPGVGVIVMLITALMATVLPPLLFEAAAAEQEIGWGGILSVLSAKLAPLLLYVVSTSALVLAAQSLALVSIRTLLRDTPMEEIGTLLVGTAVAITLMVRFCFLPFLILLHTREDLPRSLWDVPALPWVGRLAWPLIASTRLGDGHRWHLAAFVLLHGMSPAMALLVMPELVLPVMVGAHLLALAALAVIFDFFLDRRKELQFGNAAETKTL